MGWSTIEELAAEDRSDRFGYPEDEEGVVYLDDAGDEISAEEFRRRVKRRAEQLRRAEGTEQEEGR